MQNSSSYSVEDIDSGGKKFVVTSAKARIPLIRRITVSVLGFAAMKAMLGSDVFFVLAYGVPLVFAGAIFFWLKNAFVKADGKKRGWGGEFVAYPDKLVLSNGREIKSNQIHRLILRNSFSDVTIPYSPGVVAGGSGWVGLGMATGAAVGNAVSSGLTLMAQADLNRNTKIGYKLDVEFGGVAETLASGLTETTAYGLMRDVGEIVLR